MAEDIFGSLSESYNQVISNLEDDKTNVNKAVGSTIATKSMLAYKEEEDLIKTFRKNEKDHYKYLYEAELKNHKYSQKAKADLLKQEISHYTDVFNLSKKLHEKNVSFLEQERDVREKIAKSGKVSLGNLAEIYTLRKKTEELEKKTLEYKEKKFQETVDNVKKGVKTLIDHIFQYINARDDLNKWTQWKTGISELGTAYETNFNEIAARNGSETRMETHEMLKDSLETVMNSEVLKSGLNFNKEVFPQITEAVKHGFQGDQATSIAITNAIDKKIMPWLDTSSEVWVDLQYQLSEDALKQIKGQQLILQETKEGNRILQEGVVQTMLQSLEPALVAIEANTTDVSDLPEQYQLLYASFRDQGFTKAEAIKEMNAITNAYKNPLESITKGNVSDILAGIESFTNPEAGLTDIARARTIPQEMSKNADKFSYFIYDALGGMSNGYTRDGSSGQKYLDSLDHTTKLLDTLDKDGIKAYIEENDNLKEFITATQQNDNKEQNSAADFVFDRNLVRHGIDLAVLQLDEVRQIKKWLITGLIAGFVSKWADKGIDKLIEKFGTKLGGNLAGGSGSSMLSSVIGKIGGGASTTAGLSKAGLATSKAFSGLGLNAGAANAIGAGGVLAGGAMAIYGTKEAINEYSQIGKATNIEGENTKHAVSGTLAVAGAAGGAIGAGMLLASNPVGWAVLAAGGIVLLSKAAYDHANRLSGLAKQYEEHGEELKTAFHDEQSERLKESAYLKETIKNAKDDKEAQNAVINAGLLDEKSARDMTSEELYNLVGALIDTEASITALGDAAIDAKTKVAKEEAQTQTKDVLDKTYNNIKSLLGSDNVVKEGEKEYAQIKAMFEGMADSITDDKQKELMKEQLGTMFGEGEFDLAELDVLMDKGGNWRSLLHTTIDRKRNFYDYAMDVNDANAYLGLIEGNGSYDLKDVSIAQDTASISATLDKYYNDFSNSNNDKTKEMYAKRFESTWINKVKSNDNYYEYLKPQYKDIAEEMNINNYRAGSSYIQYDQIAQLHAKERVLTAEQNREYTENLIGSGSSTGVIEAGVKDLISAIQDQTRTILDYLSSVGSNTFSYSESTMNMLPRMGNTRVVF